jgi:hypothetical protein
VAPAAGAGDPGRVAARGGTVRPGATTSTGSSSSGPGAGEVDENLVVAVADAARARFVTCFYEHFDGRHPPHGRHPGRGVSAIQRRIRYREDSRRKAQGPLIIGLKVVRDG